MKTNKQTIIFNFNDTNIVKDIKNIEIYNILKNRVPKTRLANKVYDFLISKTIANISNDIDIVLIPESNNNILKNICLFLDKEYIVIKKNNKSNILKDIEQDTTIQKSQRLSILSNIQENEKLQMVNFNSSQRSVLSKYLFNFNFIELDKHKKYLILDDALFTGHTVSAIKQSLNHNNLVYEEIIIFGFKDERK
jgi:adenine/guanine phosphoribosyltransferase-like PRPP-binding protein